MSTIGIDCRFASTHSGLGRYTREIVSALLHEDSGFEFVLFVRNADEDWLRNFPRPHGIIQAPFSHYSMAEQLHFPTILKHADIDLLFSPHFNVPLRCPVPYVITVHDLILHRYPNQVSLLKRMAYRFLIKNAVRRADQIITISHFVMRELSDTYGADIQKKTTVIAEGVSPDFCVLKSAQIQPVLRKYNIRSPYFLYVGNAKEHKNVTMLMDAFRASGRNDCSLVLVTGGKEATHLPIQPNVIRLESVDDQDLPALYGGALSFVTASFYEGFGLPVLEAQACHCPVIASNSSAMPEIGGENAVYCTPTVEAFAEAMRHPPSASPFHKVASWEKAAAQTLSVLQTACQVS